MTLKRELFHHFFENHRLFVKANKFVKARLVVLVTVHEKFL